MKKQVVLLAFFTFGIALIEACSCFITCGCGGVPDALDFFDFKKLSVERKQEMGAESLRLMLQPDSVQYLAMEMARPRWSGLVSVAYACSPEDPGWAGLKFPITKINITTDQPFNDTLPAGASLNALFQMANELTFDQIELAFMPSELAKLDAVAAFPPFGTDPSWLFLVTEARPDAATNMTPFKFTITLSKNDSTEISVTSAEIFF